MGDTWAFLFLFWSCQNVTEHLLSSKALAFLLYSLEYSLLALYLCTTRAGAGIGCTLRATPKPKRLSSGCRVATVHVTSQGPWCSISSCGTQLRTNERETSREVPRLHTVPCLGSVPATPKPKRLSSDCGLRVPCTLSPKVLGARSPRGASS